MRNAGALPLNGSFIIFGGSNNANKADDTQNFAWKIEPKTQEVDFFGRVGVSGSFAPYSIIIRGNMGAIFSEDGKLYQFDYVEEKFTTPDFVERP